jgi:hypothetical protein
MTRAATVAFAVAVATAVAAAQAPQTPAAQPPVKLRSGETPVAGQCLTEEELELTKGLQALTRPTRGVEFADHDDQMRFDSHYFVGTWRIEGVLPESPLGAAGDFTGTETVRYLSNCAYESTVQAKLGDVAFTVKALQVYDRKARYMVRLEQDSRGFQLLKTGPVGGDSGGYFTHHWEVPVFTYKGRKIRLTGTTFLASPVNHRVRMFMSIDDQPTLNYGTTWWRRQEPGGK